VFERKSGKYFQKRKKEKKKTMVQTSWRKARFGDLDFSRAYALLVPLPPLSPRPRPTTGTRRARVVFTASFHASPVYLPIGGTGVVLMEDKDEEWVSQVV
jgi:hypothetical protein